MVKFYLLTFHCFKYACPRSRWSSSCLHFTPQSTSLSFYLYFSVLSFRRGVRKERSRSSFRSLNIFGRIFLLCEKQIKGKKGCCEEEISCWQHLTLVFYFSEASSRVCLSLFLLFSGRFKGPFSKERSILQLRVKTMKENGDIQPFRRTMVRSTRFGRMET